MSPQRILVVGAGGREHALAWRLSQDRDVAEVWLAPGNEGAGREHPCLDVAESDATGLVATCRAHAIDLVVIGPEAPLASGLADTLAAASVPVFGPSAAAARIESSKWFAKRLLVECGVPTAHAECCEDAATARAALAAAAPPFVLKADGLAAGKGVCVTSDAREAEAFLEQCFERDRFGPSGHRVLIEEHLTGEECSVMALCDGRDALLLPAARDYKRARDGDAGPNTGGMGAIAPSPAWNDALAALVLERVVRPVLAALVARGTPYRGALYCGLMLTASGVRVIEFNCRFGDPETQSILPLVDGAFAAALGAAAAGSLAGHALETGRRAAVTIALVDEGYPDAVVGGGTITSLDDVATLPGVHVFHAASERADDAWRVRGGRAAYVTAIGERLEEAHDTAYRAIARLGGAGWRCRHDILGPAPSGALRA
ncbi:MAG TPA: phosphoribosylamine--glycine ligase [Candidatus Saccharimonadaceae bacterium]|jgi:phosphoribosylamine--glycine ligase|nr:phosphoribosylamine--glycine ligase [Candidatus Saccharimonadaceae bacterium]